MTLAEFRAALSGPTPPANAGPLLRALGHDANGQWSAAHAIAQEREGTEAFDRLHAYLHRKEGDAFNAAYWYRRARAPVCQGSLADEWDALAAQQLA